MPKPEKRDKGGNQGKSGEKGNFCPAVNSPGRRRAVRCLGCFGSQVFVSGGPGGLGQDEELRQHPLPLVSERVIDGVFKTDGFQ